MANYLVFIIESLLNWLNSASFIFILLTFILVYHLLLIFTRDMSYIKILKVFEDPKEIILRELNHIPLINVIMPAWKEGKTFESCLLNISRLTYPSLKVIVNAGGSEETLQIANSFKKFENFTIIYQEQGGGKIKAINDCLNYVSDGIVFILDSDNLLTDKLLLLMIHPLVNGKEDIVIAPITPHTSILNSDLVIYPNLKVIVNAGGSDETLQIANSFRKFENFTVIYQEQGGGKIKAINDCLNYVSDGIVFILDSDNLLTDKLLLLMIHPLVNGKEDIVIAPITPHTSILNSDLVIYSYVNRYSEFRHKFTRYTIGFGSNVCLNFQVIKLIGKFSENRMLDDGRVTRNALSSKGFKTYKLIDHKMQSFTYPTEFNTYLHQNLRWIENFLYYSIKNRKIKLIKFVGLTIVSFSLLIFPFFLFFNVYIFLIGISILLSIYLKRIRKILFYKITDTSNSVKIKAIFYLKLIFFIYFDNIINIIASFETLFYRKAYKRRKNLIP